MHSITKMATLCLPGFFSNAGERKSRSLGIMTLTSGHIIIIITFLMSRGGN